MSSARTVMLGRLDLRDPDAAFAALDGVRAAVDAVAAAAFLNPAVGDLYADFDAEVVDARVSATNTSESQQKSFEYVKASGRRYYDDPAYRAGVDAARDDLFDRSSVPAQCSDLRRKSIAPTDRFLLDTNAVLDVFGPFPGAPTVSTVSFSEAASQIEHRLVRSRLGREPSRDEGKAARAVSELRREFVATLTQFWDDVAAIATILGAELPVDAPARSLALLARSRLDGYDPLLVHEARRHRISTIVTHDADFATVDGLVVFTANPHMLQA